jgi:hypothetical protein
MLEECKQSLLDNNINPASSVEYEINGEIHTLTLEWIISAYLQTEKKELFVELFEKTLRSNSADIELFFQQMGQLILMTSLSKQAEAVCEADVSQ